MLNRKILASALAIFIYLPLNAQTGEDSLMIRKISGHIMKKGIAYESLRHLCKKIGTRLSGSPGMYKAEQWGKELLERIGADKVYYQSCMVPHWVRGAKEEVKLVPAQKGVRPVSLAALSLGNAVGT
ncbi:MAG: peptidase M28 family protein, partial [Dinghuibacter sp.]|nr:peptidase M28 family protein [Dinghuibacter sp.]